jgi:type I restriction-modification system DNA methylase subunit/very-short-patch-repair endonuclease
MEMHNRLANEEYGEPEDQDEYLAENVFWVPPEARWPHLQKSAKQAGIGQLVDDAMKAIERDNVQLKGVLPKDYARPALDQTRLGELIDLIATIGLGDAESRKKDILGRVYEYFLARFAEKEGKGGGEFYTPQCVVRLLVEMLEPFKGRVYDPCCGSGGMFVSAAKFVTEHASSNGNGKSKAQTQRQISIFGQESNYTTWRLALMNLAIRGIDAQIKWGDSFLDDKQKDLRADFILANPPFNMEDWGHSKVADDVRWKYGTPPKGGERKQKDGSVITVDGGNANYAWIQHFLYHLAPDGTAGFVLANGSMSSNTSGEGDIRKAIIEADLVDCMIALPGQLFYTTPIPVCLWFLTRNKGARAGQSPSSPSPFSQRAKGRTRAAHYRGGFDFSGLVATARQLRKSQTPAEQILWEMLRDRRFMGLRFRRQHQFGPYILDFFCDERKLVVELDGTVHQTAARKSIDQKRDEYLRTMGLTVVRLDNRIVLDTPSEALHLIESALPPSTSGRGVGGEGQCTHRFRDRKGEVLFIDARKMGTLVDRTHRELSDEDIAQITRTYHAWRSEGDAYGTYEDQPGFCGTATLKEIKEHGYVLTPGRYVGTEAVEDDGIPFEEKMAELTAALYEQMAESVQLDDAIRANMEALGYGQ